MIITDTEITGVKIIEPRVFKDSRGYFMETWRHSRYREAGIEASFCQDNVSCSTRGVLRGLHFQFPLLQGKLIQVLEGEIFDVTVDIRTGSPSFGQWFGIYLSAADRKQVYLPPGCAHGFHVTGKTAKIFYKCTSDYAPGQETTIAWDDPDIAIEWPLSSKPLLSEKDHQGLLLKNIPASELPSFR